MPAQTYEFQAEARQLLDLVINSIYSNKEIFLRELLSNASDALDKLRLASLQNSDLDVKTDDLHIEIERDEKERILKVIDNGIGMNRDELTNLIGTIARSGTAEFLAKAAEDKKAVSDLIGQFGVGFYSVFMVAKKAIIDTRKAGEEGGWHWESDGDGSYTVEESDYSKQGTTITLILKDADEENELDDYSQEWTIRNLVKRYSDFISYPIRMMVTKHETVPAEKEGEEPKHIEKEEEETLNSMQALWARPEKEVEAKEYNEFYRHIAHDWHDPLKTVTLKGEGTFEFQSLLFIPSKAPFDLYLPDHRRGIQLYVKRVFIMDDCEDLVPQYLRFLRGVVDASDLSLNISREILQKNRQIKAINKSIVRKILGTLKGMMYEKAENGEKAEEAENAVKEENAEKKEARKLSADYLTFWNEFGKVLKEGLYNDYANRDKILETVLAATTHSAELTTLEDYVSRMKENQKEIYYIAGENRAVLEKAPQMEMFKAKGIEVLIFSDPIDSIWLETVPEFDGKKFKSILRGEIDLGDEEEKKAAEEKLSEQRKDMADLLGWMKSGLDSSVKEVRLSTRLVDSPACLVSDEQDLTPSMEKIMKAMGQEVPKVKRILELNPEHVIVKRLHELYADKKDEADLKDIVSVLYDQALLAEGGELEDPSGFSARLCKVISKALK
ncbi:molecular chaperone HtpG [bacterium]|nr:molecular chaperone HtpG [bacterium]